MKVNVKVDYKDETLKLLEVWNMDEFEIREGGTFIIKNGGINIAAFNGGMYKLIEVKEVKTDEVILDDKKPTAEELKTLLKNWIIIHKKPKDILYMIFIGVPAILGYPILAIYLIKWLWNL